jgi:hypothetical protein
MSVQIRGCPFRLGQPLVFGEKTMPIRDVPKPTIVNLTQLEKIYPL